MANGLRGSANIINNMMYNPIHQQDLSRAEGAERADNRAVSGRDRMIGKQVAGEQARLQQVDKFGDDLSMRKDKLAFAKKAHTDQIKLAQEKLSYQQGQMGLEMGLGLAAVGVQGYSTIKNRIEDKEFKKQRLEYLESMRSYIGVTPVPRDMLIDNNVLFD